MDECEPHRCQQHAPVGSGSTYEKSGSILAICSSTLAISSSANVNGKELLMATTNQPISSSSASETLGRSEPKFIVHQGPLAPKSHKTSPIWKFFGHFDSAFHPSMENFRICLICRKKGVDKKLKVGDKSSLGSLLTHLNTHPKENEEYIKAMAEAKLQKAIIPAPSQATLNFPSISNIRANFLNACAKWAVDDCQPLYVGESKSFKAMIHAANPKIGTPDAKALKRKLQIQKELATTTMKTFFKGKFFSVTLDHWTSIANENYAALTLHTIDNFVLKKLTLSCLKHEGGSTATEMDDQLAADLETWGLSAETFVAMVTDTASNMTKLGKLVEEKYVSTVPHYCADHNLQLTTQKAYSGDIVARLGGEEGGDVDVVEVLKKARDLVSHVSQSPLANSKLAAAQKRISPEGVVLVLIQDVKTRWWSTYMMLQRILVLKQAIVNMFSEEFRNREQQDKTTLLENFNLSDNDFEVINNVVHVLAPFKVAQEALEGEKYVNLSLLPMIIHKLRRTIHDNLAAIDDDDQPQFYNLLFEMIKDFEKRWGKETIYRAQTHRGDRGRITGIPKLAFWASMLDPRTKNSTMKILAARDRDSLWGDICDEIFAMQQQQADLQNNQETMTAARTLPAKNHKSNTRALTVASFLCGDSSSDEEDSETPEEASRNAIDRQIECFKAEKFHLLNKETNEYHCPLKWWSLNSTKYPDIWNLAERILHIPATSAPAERVFSVASNIINKKRARLSPETANLLIFLKENQEFAEW
jgi:hypothetical protein